MANHPEDTVIFDAYSKAGFAIVGCIGFVLLKKLTTLFPDIGWLQVASICLVTLLAFIFLRQAYNSNNLKWAMYGMLPPTFWNAGLLIYSVYGISKRTVDASGVIGLVVLNLWCISTTLKLVRINSQTNSN